MSGSFSAVKDRVSINGDRNAVLFPNGNTDLKKIPQTKNQIVDMLMTENAEMRFIIEDQKRQIERLENDLERLAMRDHLTGLYNRRFMDMTLREIIANEMRAGRSWSVIMIDIDHFKKVNDAHGHMFGDEVLINVAKKLSDVTRRGDFVVRYGGEEFAIFAFGLSDAVLEGLAERYRAEVARTETISGSVRQKVTISVGVCFMPGDMPMEVEEAIKIADSSLYAAKEQGRNCVVMRERRKNGVGVSCPIHDRRA